MVMATWWDPFGELKRGFLFKKDHFSWLLSSCIGLYTYSSPLNTSVLRKKWIQKLQNVCEIAEYTLLPPFQCVVGDRASTDNECSGIELTHIYFPNVLYKWQKYQIEYIFSIGKWWVNIPSWSEILKLKHKAKERDTSIPQCLVDKRPWTIKIAHTI